MKYESSNNYIDPYLAVQYNGCNLSPHKHYDIEIIYCLKGCVHFTVDNKNLDLYENQMIILPPLATHSSTSQYPDIDIILLKIGPAFLKKSFSYFSHATLNNLIIDLSSETDPWQIKTKDVLSDIYNHLMSPAISTELFIQSDLYRLSAYLMEFYQNSSDINDTSQYQSYIATKKMDDVFQHIFSNYYEPLTVDDMAKFTGYTKEYFCKIFRQLSGETFHKFLCRVRMEQAKFLLANTTLSISEIASTVGISEHKTFCAVFKKFTQTTPTDYRKRYSEK